MPNKKRIVELLEVGDYIDLEPALRQIWSAETLARCEAGLGEHDYTKWDANTWLWSAAKYRFMDVVLVIAKNVSSEMGLRTGLEFKVGSRYYPIWLPSEMVVELMEQYDENEEIT